MTGKCNCYLSKFTLTTSTRVEIYHSCCLEEVNVCIQIYFVEKKLMLSSHKIREYCLVWRKSVPCKRLVEPTNGVSTKGGANQVRRCNVAF